MTGEQYLRAVRDHWKLVALTVIIAVALAVGGLFAVPKKYAASADAFVLPSSSATDTQTAYQGGLLSEQRVKSYVQLFEAGRVSDIVVEQLRLPLTSDELTKKISVSTQSDTVILSITVEDESPAQALLIANTSAEVFQRLVAQLEQPPDLRLPPATSIRIVAPAKLADEPVSPQPLLYVAGGVALGLVVGLVLALWRSSRGRPLRTTDDLRDVLGVPGLGVVLRQTSPSEGLVALEHSSPEAEALRQVRTGLQFADVDHARKLVVFTSAVEGEGKTTTTSNLAAVFAAGGHRVLLIDADLRRPGAGEFLGLEQSVGLSSVLMGRLALEEAVQTHPAGFDFLATGPLPPNPSELAASDAMSGVFERVRENYEYVLVDSAPLLPVTDTAALAGLADGVVVICRFASTLDRDLRDAREILTTVRADLWGAVLSMVPQRNTGSRRYGSYGTPVQVDAIPRSARPRTGAPRTSVVSSRTSSTRHNGNGVGRAEEGRDGVRQSASPRNGYRARPTGDDLAGVPTATIPAQDVRWSAPTARHQSRTNGHNRPDGPPSRTTHS